MAIPTSTSSASVFSPNARDPNATLRKTRPPPLDAATITRTNSGWTRASPSSSLGLDLGPVDDLTAADSDRARRQAAGTVDQFRGLGSGGLLGSFQHVGHWGETVTRSLLDAASYRSRSPNSGPATPRANSPFQPPDRPPPAIPVGRPSEPSPVSSFSSASSGSSPSQTPVITRSNSSTASSPFTPSSTLSSLFSLSSLDSPETPPSTLQPALRSPDCEGRSVPASAGLERSKSKDVLGKIWRKGAGTISRRGTDPGGLADKAAADEDPGDATLRPRKSKGALSTVRGFGSGTFKNGIEGGTAAGGRASGTGLSRRLSRNFGGFDEFGFMRKSFTTSRTASSQTASPGGPVDLSMERSFSSPTSGASPPSPSDERAFELAPPRMPAPPPFFYGMPILSVPEVPAPVVPAPKPSSSVPRSGPKFGVRSLSVSSELANRDLWGQTRMVRSCSVSSDLSAVETDESAGSWMLEESLEDAQIGFGEALRFEWAGFNVTSPPGSATTFRLPTRDRSPTDTSPSSWAAIQDAVTGSRVHRHSPSLSDLDLASGSHPSTEEGPVSQRSHSRASSLSANFTIRNSSPHPKVGTPPRSSTSSSLANGHLRSASHTSHLSSASFRGSRDSSRSHSPGPSAWSSPSRSPLVAIRIIEATPAKSTAVRALPDSPDSDTSLGVGGGGLSPPRSDGSDDAAVEEAWTSARARFSESFERRTSDASMRERTLTNESSKSSSSSFGTPMLQASHSFSSFLDERRRGALGLREDRHLSTSSMPQNLLERYYAPSVFGREMEDGSSEDEVASARDENGSEVEADGATGSMIDALMAHLQGSWDDEVEDDVQAAVGWDWPMPPMREVWVDAEVDTGRKTQRSAIIEEEDDSKFFPLTGPLPARHVYVCHPSPSSLWQAGPLNLVHA